jgi:hypothetical protein
MAVSLNELDDIMRKNRKWRDFGGGIKENNRLATVMKIVYAIALEPFKITSLNNPLQTKAYNYTYYLLNWSHPEAEKMFAQCRDHKREGWSGFYYSEMLRRDKQSQIIGWDGDI